ncbi:hypothetical protein [Candidatus Chloroploca sp. Khr17]|uniref:hypothetical protein n=1 Tax=Candidatus Chloroploca sp. Khr17 TaxID=2496869 RepID=UPI00101C5873|nr:hypothetical protein [Candidatus Chloroploca sp. Khr17]
MTTQATFVLSQEEVYVALSYVRARGLLGIDPASLASVNAEERQALLAAAGRALQARGMLNRDEEKQLVLEETVRTTLNGAARAPRSLSTITRKAGQEALQSYIVHHNDGLWIKHTQPESGLHQFTLARERLSLQEDLTALFAIADQTRPQATTFTLDQAELEQIQNAVQAEPDHVAERVVAAGADEATGQLFAELLTGERDSAIVQTIDRTNPGAEEETRTVTLLHNHQGFWMMRTLNPTQLQCQPASAEEVRQMLKELIDLL